MSQGPGFQLQGNAPELYERHTYYFMQPFVQALLDRAALQPGAALLDVACGTGFVARAAAPLVGLDGRLAGVDFNGPMLEHAAKLSADIRPAIGYHEAPAEALPFGAGEFDAVLCQQGYQFFPDVAAAAADAARVLRPGGRLALTVWSLLDDSPYFQAQAHAFEQFAGPDAVDRFHAAFAFSADTLQAACAQAGLKQITVEQLTPDVSLPPLQDYVAGHLSALPWSGDITADPVKLKQAIDQIREELSDYTQLDGSVVVPFGSILVSATR